MDRCNRIRYSCELACDSSTRASFYRADRDGAGVRQIRILTINAAAVLLGLTTGAMLLIGAGLIPYWASLSPAGYRSTFAAMDFGRIMLPLGIGSFVVASTAFMLLIR